LCILRQEFAAGRMALGDRKEERIDSEKEQTNLCDFALIPHKWQPTRPSISRVSGL
jgi:hypothetical protein